MPHTLYHAARPDRAEGLIQPAGPVPREFGRQSPAPTDRWPVPLAAAAILVLSLAGWLALIQGGRSLMALLG